MECLQSYERHVSHRPCDSRVLDYMGLFQRCHPRNELPVLPDCPAGRNVTTRLNGGIRVVLDLRVAGRNRSGTGRYARELATHVATQPDVELIVLEPTFWWTPSGLFGRAVRAASDMALPVIGLPRLSAQLQADVVHGPAFLGPLRGRTPTVVTVHDTLFRRSPEDYPAWWAAYMNSVVPRVLRRAAEIIVDSHNTKADLVSDFGTPASRITVIHLGVDHARFHPAPPTEANSALQAFQLRPGYILTVGALARRKRIPSLLEAFALLKSGGRHGALQLVIAGAASPGMPGTEEVGATVRRLQLESSVALLGSVTDELLPGLYRAAAVVASASEYEGFGLTTLEAMACGAPVVVRSGSAIDEVVGDAGLQVGSGLNELASALTRVLDDEPLSRSLSAKSIARASAFTWDRTARETVEVYRRAAAVRRN